MPPLSLGLVVAHELDRIRYLHLGVNEGARGGVERSCCFLECDDRRQRGAADEFGETQRSGSEIAARGTAIAAPGLEQLDRCHADLAGPANLPVLGAGTDATYSRVARATARVARPSGAALAANRITSSAASW